MKERESAILCSPSIPPVFQMRMSQDLQFVEQIHKLYRRTNELEKRIWRRAKKRAKKIASSDKRLLPFSYDKNWYIIIFHCGVEWKKKKKTKISINSYTHRKKNVDDYFFLTINIFFFTTLQREITTWMSTYLSKAWETIVTHLPEENYGPRKKRINSVKRGNKLEWKCLIETVKRIKFSHINLIAFII